MTIYPANNPPQKSNKPVQPWTKETVPVTDGSERQMGKDSFLLLLLTQLQNQDPTNPLDNTEMTAQLAQFSQLEQLTNMSKSIDNMSGYIQAQNQFQTLSMIGKEVQAESDQLSVSNGKTDVNANIVTTETCKVIVYVLNDKKESVKKIDLGMLEPGKHPLKWNGTNEAGGTVKDGAYKFQVVATTPSGKVLEDGVYPQVEGKITSVSFDAKGQPVIHMGNASLSLGQIIKILDSRPIAATGKEAENGKKSDKESNKNEENKQNEKTKG